MGKICFMNDNNSGPEIEQTIKDAIILAGAKNKNKNTEWLQAENLEWIKIFNKKKDEEQIMDDKQIQKAVDRAHEDLDNAKLIISDINEASREIFAETGTAINVDRPPVVVLYVNLDEVRVLTGKRRAKYTIQYNPNDFHKLQDDLKIKLGEIIEISSDSESYQKNWERLINAIEVPIYTLDKNIRINFINQAAKNYFGITDNVIGTSLEEFIGRFENCILEDYKGPYEKQGEIIKAVIGKGKEQKLAFKPLIFKIDKGQEAFIRLCHLRAYYGGKNNESICIFWDIDKGRGVPLRKALEDLAAYTD
jgi:PAS domain-containing protein